MAAPTIDLTDQQQAIVNHATGPALVVAVAGAGKTTAMVHRIAHLVRSGTFPAHRILATSFNRDANDQIRKALHRWPTCSTVRVQTLHGLAYGIVKLASDRGHLPLHTSKGHIDTSGRRTLRAMIERARREQLALVPQLETLDYDDFLTYIGACKANLAYADLRRQPLPRAVRKVARQAKAPADKPWYLDAYRLYEAERRANEWLTFDDMLVSAWEALVSFPDVLTLVQRRYACVMVDEFQDVNLAQAEILDLLVQPHRNYMAIGDDDQTIYEWRGASPAFFLSFAKRYRAPIYYMTENFRGRATHLALANQVIRHNRQRQPKRLELVRGFGGHTELTLHGSGNEQAFALGRDIKALQAEGVPLRNMAVLVRVYAQTPPIEQAFRGLNVPYQIIGDVPFYQRNNAQSPAPEPTGGAHQAVTLISTFRAKGMEWPVVFLPDCNQGVVPLAKADRPEEERRLFYVALTRAQERLFLYALEAKPISPFLQQAHYADTLSAVESVGDALARDPATWTAADYVAVGVNAKRLFLLHYVAQRWPANAEQRARVAYAVLAFYATLRKHRLMRRLQIGREDVRFWQEVAASRLNPPPLELPGLREVLGRLR